MKSFRPLLLWTLLLTSFCFVASAQDAGAPAVEAPAAPKSRAERYAEAGIKTVAGPASVKLGEVAEITLKEGQLFIGPEGLDRFYELTQNNRNGKEVGVIVSDAYSLFFDFNDVGYVKDDEKDELDGEKLLDSMQKNQVAGNEARKQRGWDEIRVVDWAHSPHYDEKTHNLKWAINLSSSADQFQTKWINESIRVLGRTGIMNVTMACDPAEYTQVTREVDQLLAQDFRYVSGQRYEEWKSGDKIAEYGLTALVLGGGAVAAAKMGLFAQLGTFFAKMGKAIVLGLVAIGAVIAKFIGKLTGARSSKDGDPRA